jgi:hypothetical protein
MKTNLPTHVLYLNILTFHSHNHAGHELILRTSQLLIRDTLVQDQT